MTTSTTKIGHGSISLVPAKNLRPHPLNPRKNLGDLAELTDSIKKNGILQNLTAVPDPDRDDGYLILIGHRRFAAGKKAGLTEFPCVIASLNEPDQVKLMLCENIQRNDLTVAEQAQGFQMMIDFGISVKELAEQTGFAQSTIYHRLNIAKLDQKALKKKLSEITITDLIEMEKIEDIKTRNEILKNADRTNIRQKIERAYADQEAKKTVLIILQKCIDAGLQERQTNCWARDIIIHDHFYAYDKIDTDKLQVSDGAEFYCKQTDTSIFTYELKGEPAPEDPEQTAIENKVSRIEDEIGEQLDKLKEARNEIYEEIRAFGAVAKEGKYNRLGTKDFMLSFFRFIATSSYSLMGSSTDEFKPEAHNLCTKWNYSGPPIEWFDTMIDSIGEEVGDDPVVYAYIGLRERAKSNRGIAHGYATGLMRDASRPIMDSSAAELRIICRSLEYIGFRIDADLLKYLDEDNPCANRIRELSKEFRSLMDRGGKQEQ